MAVPSGFSDVITEAMFTRCSETWVVNVPQKPNPVPRLDSDPDWIQFLGRTPLDLNQALLFVLVAQIGAVSLVDRHAGAPGDIANDLLAGERVAAPTHADQEVANP